ncbi:hypothetical protein B0I37DRAFT_417813 [Chaetomium sp. MPI-CAGE-AT-0009]|nr:hypothetical protein B0I37DRAFT_417813 [Chaetomium sp. MPI-CAGE-AT-0009]
MAWKLSDYFTGRDLVAVLLLAAINMATEAYFGQDSPFDLLFGVSPKTSITHILLVSFKPSASQDTIDAICKRIIAFKETCRDAQGKPYILATSGGINNNPEHSNKNMTHGFVIEFKNDADRRYFLHVDQVHKHFLEHIDQNNDDFLTLDFTSGVYRASV